MDEGESVWEGTDCSELSEDSMQLYQEDPTSSESPAPSHELGPLYWACVCNEPAKLQATLDQGISPEEATQVDRNGRVRKPAPPPCTMEQDKLDRDNTGAIEKGPVP